MEMRILILGLDNSGKTTILKRINGEPIDTISPTLGMTLGFRKHDNSLNNWKYSKGFIIFWRLFIAPYVFTNFDLFRCFRLQHKNFGIQRMEVELLGCRRSKKPPILLAQLFRTNRRRHLGGRLGRHYSNGRLCQRVAFFAGRRSPPRSFPTDLSE